MDENFFLKWLAGKRGRACVMYQSKKEEAQSRATALLFLTPRAVCVIIKHHTTKAVADGEKQIVYKGQLGTYIICQLLNVTPREMPVTRSIWRIEYLSFSPLKNSSRLAFTISPMSFGSMPVSFRIFIRISSSEG